MTTASARIVVDGVALAYDLATPEAPPTGPLVVLLPGMGDLRGAYRHLTPLLTARGLRVAALDLPGHGGSGISPEPVSQSQIARAAAALAAQLGGPAIVVGHSFTPDSALLASQLAPTEIVGAVALAPWATTPEQPWPIRLLARVVAGTPLLWSMFYRSLHAVPPADLADHRARIVDSLRRRGGTAALVTMAGGTTKDATGARATQVAPVLVLMGDADPDFRDPAAEAQTFADAVGAAAGTPGVRMIANAGHYPHAEQPEAVADALLAFASSLGWQLAVPRA